MSTLTTIGGKLRINTAGGGELVLSPKPGSSEPCCCDTKNICWYGTYGGLFAAGANDTDILSSTTDIVPICNVLVNYYSNQCAPYNYFPVAALADFINNGGIYITHCEWTNCGVGTVVPGTCDPDGAAFNSHMSALGCSLHRGRGTISTALTYTSLGSQLFSGCNVSGNATAEILGGTPLLNAAPSYYCQNEAGGTCCAGEKIGAGAIIAFGDSNVYISAPIRDNLLTTAVADLF